MKKHLVPFLAALGLLAACDPKNKETPTPAPDVFILNEGNFRASDGEVSTFHRASKTLTPDAFGRANGRAQLGDVVQHMGSIGNRGYIVVNNSRKIEVVNLPDFKTVATIGGLEQPRYFTATSATRGYVTEWRGDYSNYQPGFLTILDLTTNTVTNRVPVGKNPEQLLALGGKIYVPNNRDNTISVVDETTGSLVTTFAMPDRPTSMVADKNGAIWVLCSGITSYTTVGGITTATITSAGTLVRFDPSSPTTQFRLTFPATAMPKQLRTNPAGDQLYYSFGGAEYQVSIGATTLPTMPFIRRSFSGFAIDPRDNTVYGAIAPSYTSNGRFIRYQPTGLAIDSFEVKVGPNGFVFY